MSTALREGLELKSEQDKMDYHLGVFGEWADSDPEAELHETRAKAEGLLRALQS